MPNELKKRKSRVLVRLSPKSRETLRKNWDPIIDPDKVRTYPNPLDPSEQLHFGSEQEYLEFCVGCLNAMPNWAWVMFSNMLNPNYPKGD